MTKNNLSPRKKASQKRSQETVKAILEAATQLLNTKGGGEFTTNHIAKKAGVSIGSLYQYFPNKNSISSKILDNFVEEQGRRVLGKLLEVTAPEQLDEVIKWVVHELYKFRTEEIVVTRAVAYEISKGEFHNKMAMIKSELSKNILLFLHGLKGVEVHSSNQLKVDMIVESVDSTIYQLAERDLSPSERENGLEFVIGIIKYGLKQIET